MTDETREEQTALPTGEQTARRRSALWLLGGLVLFPLSVLVVLQVFGLWEIFTPDTASDTLLLYALSSLNFVAFIVFTFIFVRNLVKLRRERRERQLGSKIKTRLVVYFIVVSLLPITAMAVFSYIFFNRTLEKWFSLFPEGVVWQARAAHEDELQREAQALQETAQALGRLMQRQPVEELHDTLRQLIEPGRLAMLAIVANDGRVIARTDANSKIAQNNELSQSVQLAAEGLNRAGGTRSGPQFNIAVVSLGDQRVLVAAREKRPAPHLESLVASGVTFEDFKKKQRKVRLLGLSTLGLLTLMLLFAATWSAIHLARGISTPIRALAEAADEVAGGNLEHRVTAIADDELALLASSFNEMTRQLAENRRRIEMGAAELRDKNLALAERRDYIETILESLSTGVISVDGHDGVTTINAAALVMLRLESAPRARTKLAEIIGGEDYTVLARVLRRARLRGRATEQMELARSNGALTHDNGLSPEHASGGTVPVALTAIALNSRTSEGWGVVLVMEDLSELLAAQRAAAWSEVARRMAHEIKNPLTPIQLSAERIARNFQRDQVRMENAEAEPARTMQPEGNGSRSFSVKDPEKSERARVARIVEECTTTITREVAGLKAMVDEFSRFARLPHARLEHADLNEVARQALGLYEERMGEVRLEVRLAHTLPVAMLDPEQIRRVLVNLIDNALEAVAEETEGEPRITVATAHDPARGLLLAEVADTGHGIAHADSARLFQPYFSTRGRGTGLGLAIVQRIITEHGGRIRAEANRPRGARFIFELPVADETKHKDEGGRM